MWTKYASVSPGNPLDSEYMKTNRRIQMSRASFQQKAHVQVLPVTSVSETMHRLVRKLHIYFHTRSQYVALR